MNFKESKTIGIVGGMGPQAGAALYDSIISNTGASTDQQHLPVVLMAFPGKIEDRTLFLEGKVLTNPAYQIVEVIKKLVIAGADVIGLACNTSHAKAIFEVIESRINKFENKPLLLNMPLEVCNYISENHAGISRIGLMTTNGSYKSGLYKNLLQEKGYEVVIPDFTFQDSVIHRMIYDPIIGIKANPTCITKDVIELCGEAISFFKKNNAEAIVLGCTELPLVFKAKLIEGMLIIDSTECLAKALIREAVRQHTGNVYQADSLVLI